MNDERPMIKPEESDAAKRMMDAINIHVQASRASGREKPGWVAIRLSDGTSPTGDLYDSRSDAVRYHGHDSYVFYVKVGKDTIGFREALLVLQQNRQARNMGVVFQREQVVMPNLSELLTPYLPRTLEGLRNDE